MSPNSLVIAASPALDWPVAVPFLRRVGSGPVERFRRAPEELLDLRLAEPQHVAQQRQVLGAVYRGVGRQVGRVGVDAEHQALRATERHGLSEGFLAPGVGRAAAGVD